MNNCEKCGYYSDGECSICGMGMSGEDTFCRLCKDNPNCYYKQLNKLKTKKDKYYQQTLDDEIQINELYQVLQEIKAIVTGVRGYLEVPAPRDVRYEMDRILDLITKAEEE